MAHFAELNSSNEVIRVLVVDDSDIMDGLGVVQEQLGIDLLVNLVGGTWIQIGENDNTGVGHTYYPDAGVFVSESPHATWTLNDNYEWVAPAGLIYTDVPDMPEFPDQT